MNIFCLCVSAVFQETLEKQLCDPQFLTPDFSKPEVSAVPGLLRGKAMFKGPVSRLT